MAISSFIPTVWSETLLSELNSQYIGVRNCNREFEGDIKDKGSVVKIGSIGDISVFNYTKDTDMQAPQTLSDSAITLTINQAKAFNFQIDDIDRAQSQPKIMKAALRKAANALADVADKYIYKLYSQASEDNFIIASGANSSNIIEWIAQVRQKMIENGVTNSCDLVLEVSPMVAAMILQAKLNIATDNTGIIENGYIGKVLGFDVYTSHNVDVDLSGVHKCYARTRRAIAFAEQLNEVEAYRPESRFADAIKGLHLYGAKIVYPKEFFVLEFEQ